MSARRLPGTAAVGYSNELFIVMPAGGEGEGRERVDASFLEAWLGWATSGFSHEPCAACLRRSGRLGQSGRISWQSTCPRARLPIGSLVGYVTRVSFER